MTKPTTKIKKVFEDKTGVSPIIAVILMVAITVVLAATIYVWVSGFGGGTGSSASIAMDQTNWDSNTATYEVRSAQGGLGWENVEIAVDGTPVWNIAGSSTTDATITSGGGTLDASSATAISAGDTVEISTGGIGSTVTITNLNTGSVVFSADINYA